MAERTLDRAAQPLASGPVRRLQHGALCVDIAPQAGGRIAQITYDGLPWLVGPDDGHPSALAWGSYPMLPWAGRLRRGRLRFGGRGYRFAPTLGPHTIHGVGFQLPWKVAGSSAHACRLVLQLPTDARWPFSGIATQHIALDADCLTLQLSLRATTQAMPRPVIGWHPWFRKPVALEFTPVAQYPRDGDGIAHRPTMPPSPGPWDDCFINRTPVTLRRDGQTLRLSSGCDHWVVYDQPAHASCVEPQSGPPDAFNLHPRAWLAPGRSVHAWFRWQWC